MYRWIFHHVCMTLSVDKLCTVLYDFFLFFLGDEQTARQFLYDTLFFRNTRAHCMITVLLDTWPEIFSFPNESPDILFEVCRTLHLEILNSTFDYSLY